MLWWFIVDWCCLVLYNMVLDVPSWYANWLCLQGMHEVVAAPTPFCAISSYCTQNMESVRVGAVFVSIMHFVVHWAVRRNLVSHNLSPMMMMMMMLLFNQILNQNTSWSVHELVVSWDSELIGTRQLLMLVNSLSCMILASTRYYRLSKGTCIDLGLGGICQSFRM